MGAAINYFGGDVAVIDANLSTPNIGIHLNCPEVPINLNHVLQKKAEVFESVYEHESGLKIIPSSISIKELKKIEPGKIKDFKKDFKKIADYIIMDSAAGLGQEALCVIDVADEVIIISNPEMPAITDALKTIRITEQMKKPVAGVIMTRVRKNNSEIQPEVVREMLEIPILGMVPEDLSVQEALSMKNAVVHTHPNSKPARAYKEIAARIMGVRYDSSKDKENLLDTILKKFKIVNWGRKK